MDLFFYFTHIHALTHLYCAKNLRLFKLNCTYLVAHQMSVYQEVVFHCVVLLKSKLLGFSDLFGDALKKYN